MRKAVWVFALLMLTFILPASAQEATPESGSMAGGTGITVSDQVVVNGMVTIDSAPLQNAGWVVIHADMMGQPGHVVGIAAASAGDNAGVTVMIDGAMSTPTLHVALHEDTGEAGVFEHADDPSLDPPVTGADGAPAHATFRIAAIFAFDQQAVGDNVVVASTIFDQGGWLVIHADNGGSPGAVLGQTPINPGVTAPAIVPISAEGRTDVVYPMLHLDDNTVGTYEFGAVEGADAPVAINGAVAVMPVTLRDEITVVLADGTPVDGATLPSAIASPQNLNISEQSVNFTVDLASSPMAGFIDVHNDVGHPGGSLGVSPILEGDNSAINVTLMPKPNVPITAVVWPMLHADTDGDGVYQYLKVVGEDLPIILNGMVVTLPVPIADMFTGTGGGEMGTAEATMEGEMGGAMATAEATTSP